MTRFYTGYNAVRILVAPGQSPKVPLPSFSNDSDPRIDGPSSNPSACGLRILMVDDHVDTSSVMRRLLSHLGHQVQTAGSVSSALEAAGNGPFDRSFDLLISDIGLPDGSGLDLLNQLRSSCGDVRAIAISGWTQADDINRSRAAGFREHLTKPVSMATLEEAIRRASERA